jgi:SPOR domain
MDDPESALTESIFANPKQPRRVLPWMVLVLLLANLGLAGYLFLYRSSGEDMAQHAPYNADRIRFLSKPGQSTGKAASATPAGMPALCLEWGPVVAPDVDKARKSLAGLVPDALISTRTAPQQEWWVHIPNLDTRAQAENKMNELRGLRVRDSSVVEDGVVYAVSLGLFSSEAAAGRRLEELRRQGVKSAVAKSRPAAKDATFFILGTLGEDTMKGLIERKRDFPGSDVKASPCPRG